MIYHQSAIERALAPTQSEWGSSRYGEWRRCPRAHDLKYRLGLIQRPRPADDLGDWELDDTSYFALGGLCHSILRYVQECALGLPDATDPAAWPEVAHAWRAAQESPTDAWETEANALALMGAYWGHYGLENGGWPESVEILAVEVPLGVSAGVLGPLPYTATADAILRMPGGEIVIADHKTRGQALPKDRARLERSWRTSPQFVGLSWLVREAYRENRFPNMPIGALVIGSPPAVWVNALIKPTKAQGPRFERILVRLAEQDLNFWAAAQEGTAIDLDHEQYAIERGCVSRCDPSACAPAIGSRCWAFEYCHGSAESKAKHYMLRNEITGAKGASEGE